MTFYPTNTVIVHSTLTDLAVKGGRAISLWYYCRALDATGRGMAQFLAKDAAQELGVSVDTVYRYLKDGLRLGLYRNVVRSHGQVTVYYVSIGKVCAVLGIKKLGGVAHVPVKCLKSLREVGTEIMAISLQRASFFAAKKEAKKTHFRGQVANAEWIGKPSVFCPGGTVRFISDRFLFLNDGAMPSGTSQSRIGEELGRHRTTVCRRLSGDRRVKKDLLPLARKQVAVVQEDSLKHAIEAPFDVVLNQRTRFFVCAGKAWKSCCNLYADQIELIPYRFRRKDAIVQI